MNVFIIPSWYPSKSNPLNGIFIFEQTIWMAQQHPDINFGISTWGQNDEDYLLYAHEPFKSLKKAFFKKRGYEKKLMENVFHFFEPAFSYSSRFNRGNINRKVKACLTNLTRFEKKVGKVDLIHVHVCYPGGYIAQQLSRRIKKPYIITEHMAPFPQIHHVSKGELKKAVRDAILDADMVLAVSEHTKREMAFAGIQRDIRVIPNWHHRNESLNSSIKKRDKFTFITVCGIQVNKGLIELLEAIKMAIQVDPDINFLIVGEGPDSDLVMKKIDQLQIGDVVQFLGPMSREATLKLYAEAHAHILTSHYESFGVVYVEAMAAGLPSIANAFGGPLDILDDRTGIFVENMTPEEISKKILWLKQNYDRFNAEEIVSIFENRFSAKKVTNDLKEHYNSLIKMEYNASNL